MNFFFKFLISTLFLILIYVFYKSEIYWDGSIRAYYFFYFIGILLAIFFSIICTYLNVKIQKYIIIIFISTIFALYFFEGKLIFDQNKNYTENIKINNLNFDRRERFEVYEDLKKNNSNITVIVHPKNFLKLNDLDFLSLAGISNTKTIYCNENGYYSVYQSDRYGFNNPDKEWDSKEIEYLLVGDSFTHGACVNRPHDVASVLRNYSKKNVLNLGQGGNGPLIEYATLREYLTPNVKKVLWLYYEGNDLIDLKNELDNKILNKYLTNQKFKQDLKFRQNQIDKYLTDFVEKEIERARERVRKRERESHNIHNAKIVRFIKLVNIRSSLHSPSPPPPPELKIVLKLANELVESYNQKLYFIYLPSFDRYTQLLKRDFKQEVKNIVIDLGIEFIDIDDEVFKKEKNPLKIFSFEKYNHYNVEGYKKIALKIYEKTR
jgi:hypothetical protein